MALEDFNITRANKRYILSLTVLISAVIILLLASIGLLIYEVFQLHRSALAGEAQRDQLIACTTPGHSCYDQAQKNTAAAVQEIIDSMHKDHQVIKRECK